MISEHLLETTSDYTGVASAEDALGVVMATAAGNYVSTTAIGTLFGYAASLVAGPPGFWVGRFVGKLAADVIVGIGLAAFGKIFSKKLSAMWHQVAGRVFDQQPVPIGDEALPKMPQPTMSSGGAMHSQRRPVTPSRSHYARLASQHARHVAQPHPFSHDNRPEAFQTAI